MWKKSEKNLPLIVISISLIAIVFFSQVFSNDSRIKILNIFRMPLKAISCSYYVLRNVAGFKELRNENKILREDMHNLRKALSDLREFRLENKRLKELLGFQESKQNKFIPAMVIARDPSGLRDTIVIDKGKKHGVQKDMLVISGSGLVGRVRECGWTIARALLITDRDSALSAIVQRTRDEGSVTGSGRSRLIMKYLDLGCGVTEGDKVITSGFGGVFEKGILVGEVVSIARDESGLYMNAVIKPEADMMRLEEVLVMR